MKQLTATIVAILAFLCPCLGAGQTYYYIVSPNGYAITNQTFTVVDSGHGTVAFVHKATGCPVLLGGEDKEGTYLRLGQPGEIPAEWTLVRARGKAEPPRGSDDWEN